MHFDDIVRNFRASRLDNDKNSVISRLPFIQYVRNLPFDISIYLTDPDVVSISSFYIYFNMPYEFGRNSDIVIIDTYEFISFLSFLNVYSIQCGLVMMLH